MKLKTQSLRFKKDIWDQLVTNSRFIGKAKKARQALAKDPTQFPNITIKYKDYINNEIIATVNELYDNKEKRYEF